MGRATAKSAPASSEIVSVLRWEQLAQGCNHHVKRPREGQKHDHVVHPMAEEPVRNQKEKLFGVFPLGFGYEDFFVGDPARVTRRVVRNLQELAQVLHGVLLDIEFEQPLLGDPPLRLLPVVLVLLFRLRQYSMATFPALMDPPLIHRLPPAVVQCRFAHPTRGAVARVVEQRVACQGVHDGQNDGAVGEQRGTKVAEGRDLLDAAQVAHEIGDRLGPLLVRPPVQHDDFGIGTDLIDAPKESLATVAGQRVHTTLGESLRHGLCGTRRVLDRLHVSSPLPPLRRVHLVAAHRVGRSAGAGEPLPREHTSPSRRMSPVFVQQRSGHMNVHVVGFPGLLIEFVHSPRHRCGARLCHTIEEHLDARIVHWQRLVPAQEANWFKSPVPKGVEVAAREHGSVDHELQAYAQKPLVRRPLPHQEKSP
mmetsp:Transcript_19709/g.40108  ORF Transcript_19709/g.40108 Transcript_19709/m.40108 type:complete len:422 (-) Transcript_19709:116-1381(-)